MSDTPEFKLGTFSAGGQPPFAGLVLGDRAIAVAALAPLLARAGLEFSACASMLDLLEEWERSFSALCWAARAIESGEASELKSSFRPMAALEVHAPVPRPGTVYCSGANYKKHVVDLVVAPQEQVETQGMTLEEKRAWGMKIMDERAAIGTPFIFIKPQSTVTGPFDPVVIPFDAKKTDWEGCAAAAARTDEDR